MERLTERERNIDGTGVAKEEITDGLLKPFAEKILTKLADYEDLEEQGLLVRLPYNNGTLYSVNYSNKTITENTIIEIAINGHAKRFSCLDDNLRERKFYDYMIGENVFLNREEAEKKLEEMQNG
jgi:hypothetical protein|nr:MAG TPA: hypothetical protein [Caudoviricetes sp.]